MKLVIGNKNYSSWSMRAWMALRCFEFEFEEIRVPLFSPGYKEKLAGYSSAARVPILVDGDIVVSDSLAICEYLAESNPAMWPSDQPMRSSARSITSEMHSSFFNVRDLLPLNCRQNKPVADVPPALQQEIDRVFSIWRECLAKSQGPFLLGQLSIADIFYSPVISRFTTYQIHIPNDLVSYVDTVKALEPYQRWHREAEQEPESIETVDSLSGESLR